MCTDQPAYVASFSPFKLVLLLLASVAFVIGGLWMVGLFGEVPDSRKWSPELIFFIGIVAILFFGACGAVIGKELVTGSKEAFRIDAYGITHNQQVKDQFSWDEITRIYPTSISGQSMICYEVVQERTDQLGLVQSKLAAANRSMTGCSFALNFAGTNAKMDEAIAALTKFAPPHLILS